MTATDMILYKTYIRPHMEYCVQAWCPHLHRDIQIFEKVQQSAGILSLLFVCGCRVGKA